MPQLGRYLKKICRPRMLAVVLSVLVIALCVISFKHSPSYRNNKTEGEKTDADFHLKAVTFREFKRDKPVWEMVAEDAQIFQENDIAFLINIQSTFHQEDGKIINITGKEASIRLSSMNLSLSGDIHAISEDGTQLFAKSLEWDNEKRKLASNNYIRIIRGNIQLEGNGLELYPDQQLMTIKNGVRTRIENTDG